MGWGDRFKQKQVERGPHGGLLINPTPPPATLHDHLGRVLGVGDAVVMAPGAVTWRVVEITPVLQPGAPPGLVRARIVASADIVLPGGERAEGVYRIQTAGEIAAANAPVGSNPPEEPETTDTGKPTTLVVD